MNMEEINTVIEREIKRRFDPLFIPDAYWYDGPNLSDRDAEIEIVHSVERFGQVYSEPKQ